MYAGQLVELAKMIQIEELKRKCSEDFPVEKKPQPGVEPERWACGHYLGDKAFSVFKRKLEELPPCSPAHMREARIRMMQNNSFIEDKPKCMFKRKKFWLKDSYDY